MVLYLLIVFMELGHAQRLKCESKDGTSMFDMFSMNYDF